MAIQLRHGAYADFQPNKMTTAEPAVVTSGDPNTTNGKSTYVAYGANDVERLLTDKDKAAQDAINAQTTAALSDMSGDIDALEQDVDDLKSDLEELEPITEDIKVALLNCFEHVAWIDEYGQNYYDALEEALYPDTGLVRITAVFTQGSTVIYPTTPLNDLKAYLVVTGYYRDGTSKAITDYSLSGTLEVGTSTITVTKEGKTATFTVTVSAPYWDFEWYSSSGVLPEGMTTTDYDFTTEPGVLFAKTPRLDFDYTGDCKLQIEMKSYSENTEGSQVFAKNNNPQFQIQNAVLSTNPNQFRGIKIIFDYNSGTSSSHGVVGVGINGTNALISSSNSNEYHLYEVTAENNNYALTIDENPVTITQNTNMTPYVAFTGITASSLTPPAFYGIFIKSIKFKRLS